MELTAEEKGKMLDQTLVALKDRFLLQNAKVQDEFHRAFDFLVNLVSDMNRELGETKAKNKILENELAVLKQSKMPKSE